MVTMLNETLCAMNIKACFIPGGGGRKREDARDHGVSRGLRSDVMVKINTILKAVPSTTIDDGKTPQYPGGNLQWPTATYVFRPL